MKIYNLIFVLFTVFVFSSCEDDPADWGIDREKVEELINSSSDVITIDEKDFELHAYLWRDFMPMSPPNGKELIAINWLVDMDSLDIPDHISLSKQYVIHGDSIWMADYANEIREPRPYVLERISRDGPKWGPDIKVTVVAKVVDLRNGSEYYVRRRDQLIERTD
jgi:hypothetical protein